MNKLNKALLKRIESIDISELPRIYCYLNRWEFPDELIDLKPNNWELYPILNKHEIISDGIDYIKNNVNEKELSREWNKDRMTPDEFEEWWNNKEPLSDLAKELLNYFYKIEIANNN